MKSIDEHIKKDQTEIEAAKAAGDDAKVRHLEGELNSLKEYKEHNPGDKHDPRPWSCTATPIPKPMSAASTTTDRLDDRPGSARESGLLCRRTQ